MVAVRLALFIRTVLQRLTRLQAKQHVVQSFCGSWAFCWGVLPPNRILPGAKFTLRPSLAFSYIGSVTARHSQLVSSKLRHGTRNGIMELLSSSFSTEGATYIPRAAITLGIGPHPSWFLLFFPCWPRDWLETACLSYLFVSSGITQLTYILTTRF